MTYFLTAISLEQQKMQKILDDFKHHIQDMQSGISTKVQDHYFHSLDVTIKNFYQIEKQCHARKVDLYLIPAIHKSTPSTEQILAELESLKSGSMELFTAMQHQFEACLDKGISTMGELCNALKEYCELQQTILTKEENELLPMATQSLPFDVWFSISAKCLADQEKIKGRGKIKDLEYPPRTSHKGGDRSFDKAKTVYQYANN